MQGMVYWRFKTKEPTAWRFGYVTRLGQGLVRMGAYNGDTIGGVIVDPAEIEYRPYSS